MGSRSLAALVAAIAFAGIAAPAHADPESEDNGTVIAADGPMRNGVEWVGSINPGTDVDFFYFGVRSNVSAKVTLRNLVGGCTSLDECRIYLRIYDESGQAVGFLPAVTAGNSAEATFKFTNIHPGSATTLTVQVYAVDGPRAYGVTITGPIDADPPPPPPPPAPDGSPGSTDPGSTGGDKNDPTVGSSGISDAQITDPETATCTKIGDELDKLDVRIKTERRNLSRERARERDRKRTAAQRRSSARKVKKLRELIVTIEKRRGILTRDLKTNGCDCRLGRRELRKLRAEERSIRDRYVKIRLKANRTKNAARRKSLNSEGDRLKAKLLKDREAIGNTIAFLAESGCTCSVSLHRLRVAEAEEETARALEKAHKRRAAKVQGKRRQFYLELAERAARRRRGARNDVKGVVEELRAGRCFVPTRQGG